MNNKCILTKLPHHLQQKLCCTRPPYRQGKRLTSVKVYTVNDESTHLMIHGVPKLQLHEEVRKLVGPYGNVKNIHVVPDYPTEEFTEAFYVQYDRIQSARVAKRFLDGKNFYGASLHVFYVPELETVSETRTKLLQRRRDVTIRIKRNQNSVVNPDTDKFTPKEQYHRKKRTPALPLTEERLRCQYPGETLSSIYNGIPQSLDRRPISEPSLPSTSNAYQENYEYSLLQTPYQLTETIIRTTEAKEVTSNLNLVGIKRKNYKGQSVNNSVKIRVVRPQLVDTSTIVKWDNSSKNVFSNPKKAQRNITIKLIEKNENKEKKRIIIKDPSVSQLIQPIGDLQSSIKEAKSQVRAAMQNNNKKQTI